jgi:predicted  nucleic acid-binding Zn-ribbon protein
VNAHEGKDALAAAKAEVEALRAENERLQMAYGDLLSRVGEHQALRERAEKAERDTKSALNLANEHAKLRREVEDQLAAAQARERSLREALAKVPCECQQAIRQRDDGSEDYYEELCVAHAALSAPQDEAALRGLMAEAVRMVAPTCDAEHFVGCILGRKP